MLQLSSEGFLMKKLISVICTFLFNVLCSVFRCNYKSLDNACESTGELPVSPKEVRKTLLYKRLKRFVRLSLLFKDYDLILGTYYFMPASVGRCVWNILRDETKYIIHCKGEKMNCCTFVLGKWVNKKFVELAYIETTIEEALEVIDEEFYEDDFESCIIKGYYLENSNGYMQLVKDGDTYLVGWNAVQSINNPDWSYSVRRFDSFQEAEAAYEEMYKIDKGCGNAI